MRGPGPGANGKDMPHGLGRGLVWPRVIEDQASVWKSLTRAALWGGAGPAGRDSTRSFCFIELCVVFIISREVGDTFDTRDVRTGLGVSQSSEYIPPHPVYPKDKV